MTTIHATPLTSTGEVVQRIRRILMTTEARTDLTVIRVLAAAVLLPHGAQKVLGLFGGFGWSATYEALTSSYGLWGPVAALVMILELVAPIALAAGAATRVAATAIAVLMMGAATYHFEHGFFMNWFGQQAGEGFQFHLAYVAALLPLATRGGGRWSVDALLDPPSPARE